MQINIGKKMTVALIVGAYAGKRIALRPKWWIRRFSGLSRGLPGLKTYNVSMLRLWVCVSREVYW